MEIINSIWEYSLLGNTVSQIFISVGVLFVIVFFLKYLLKFLERKVETIDHGKHSKIGTTLVKIIHETPKYFFWIIGIYIPLKLLKLPELGDQIINILFMIVFIVQIIRIANIFMSYALRNIFNQHGKIDHSTQKIIKITIKIVIWIIGILLVLTNSGVEITPILASLGLGGIAVAFALQNILEDLFSSLSILFSRPFKVGDWIIVGSNSGTVKNITLKSTHITSNGGNEIIIPNREVLKNSIDNYGDMPYRRKKFTLDVVYETSVKKLKNIENIIKSIIDKQDDIVFERTRVRELGAYSIIFETSYKLEKTDFKSYIDTHQNIIFEILEAFEKEGIAFAYPTQVVYTPDRK